MATVGESATNPPNPLRWTAENRFVIGDAKFLVYMGAARSSPDHFVVFKTRALVDRYVEILRELRPRNIVEIGVYQGGSTAMLAELARPTKLVAIEFNPQPVRALDEFIDARGLRDAMRVCYGVDQADHDRLTSIVADEFGDEPIDLVIDDASHFLDETARSFDTLFPYVGPGGVYVIEDWAWAHVPGFDGGPIWPDRTPLSVMLFELTIAAATAPGIVEQIVIDRDLACVRRGREPIEAAAFNLSALCGERGRGLLGSAREGSRAPATADEHRVDV
jgi:hypothetical protein